MTYTELKNVPKFYFAHNLICQCEKSYNFIALESASAHGRAVSTESLTMCIFPFEYHHGTEPQHPKSINDISADLNHHLIRLNYHLPLSRSDHGGMALGGRCSPRA